MKKTVTVVLILFLACIVGYGGAGVNYINYCCHECAVQGVDAVVNDLCCETHGHDHVNFMNEKGEVFRHDGDCLNCGLKRVKFEWTDDTDHEGLLEYCNFIQQFSGRNTVCIRHCRFDAVDARSNKGRMRLCVADTT